MGHTNSFQAKTTTLDGDGSTSIHTSRRTTRHTTHTRVSQQTKPATTPSSTSEARSSKSHSLSPAKFEPSVHPRSSSSRINAGPAITASSVPPSIPANSHLSSQQATSHLSGSSKKALIASTTIGGILILVLLIYALWRRRKGATYSEIIRFRPQSGTIVLSASHDDRSTALPIYREERYSVRSSRIGSSLGFGRAIKRPSEIPPNVAERFHTQQPWIQSTWKTANPPTPTTSTHPLAQVTAASSNQIDLPQMKTVDAEDTRTDRAEGKASTNPNKSGLAISINETPPIEDELGQSPDILRSDADLRDHCNANDSQLPPMPKFYASSYRSSLSSIPTFKTVKSWVRAQAERQSRRNDEERAPPSRATMVPTFRNKASKPNLAPKPTRKLSKRKPSQNEFSLIIQQNSDIAGSAHPAP